MVQFVGTVYDNAGIKQMWISIDNGPFVLTSTSGNGERWDIENGTVSPKQWSWQAWVLDLAPGSHLAAFRIQNNLGYGAQIGPVKFQV